MITALKDESRHDLYIRAYINTVKAYGDNPELGFKETLKKMIVYGVKAVITKSENELYTREGAEADFQFIQLIKDCMAILTPREFMNIYPISKEYDGHKYQMKDYFYTREYLKGLDMDKPIGEEILMFLWEYHNWELTYFNVEAMEALSRLRKADGQKGIAEEVAEILGLKTYTMFEDNKGNEFLIDKETNKTMKVKKKRSKHLKVIR